MTQLGISVLCPCRNEAATIDACVQSLLTQKDVPGSLELIIIDGNSDDGTWEILQGLAATEPRLRLVRNPQRHAAAALNLGLALSRGDIVVRVDAHSTYATDYVASCVAVLQETGADNVGGAARTRPTGWMQGAIAAAYHSPFSTGGARFHQPDYEGAVDTVTYGCWPRRTFARFGLFDETLLRNQDDEHNLRIVRGGGTVWQSRRIVSWYAPRSTLRQLFRQYMDYGYWKVRVIQKHGTPASWRHLVPGLCLVAGVGLAVAAPLSTVARNLLAAGLAAYAVLVAVASLHAGWRQGWRYVPVLPAVFATYHLGYGSGFLRGWVGPSKGA